LKLAVPKEAVNFITGPARHWRRDGAHPKTRYSFHCSEEVGLASASSRQGAPRPDLDQAHRSGNGRQGRIVVDDEADIDAAWKARAGSVGYRTKMFRVLARHRSEKSMTRS